MSDEAKAEDEFTVSFHHRTRRSDTPRKMKSRSFETNPTSDKVDFVLSLQTAHHRAAFLHSQITALRF